MCFYLIIKACTPFMIKNILKKEKRKGEREGERKGEREEKGQLEDEDNQVQ